ncbi:MAG: ribosome biogenesis GTPase YlqF [Eubacteriales bacterium]|nr:ribosome biogenesis GTPase YlqF [Eubacteriales bacterium]
MSINWYPGHMAKSKRILSEQLGRVNAVVELCDARVPIASRNPDLIALIQNKPSVLVLNKADLADAGATKLWLNHYKQQGVNAIAIQANNKSGVQKTKQAIRNVLKDIILSNQNKGIRKTLRVMVVGVPNVGKSTFINALSKSSLVTEDRPGVTRAPQWVKLSDDLLLLDTPGLLWPKLDNESVSRHLAYIASVSDKVVDLYKLCIDLLNELMELAPSLVLKRYKLDDQSLRGEELLNAICQKRGFLLPGAQYDIDRAVNTVINEFRDGLIGRITLEKPEDLSFET